MRRDRLAAVGLRLLTGFNAVYLRGHFLVFLVGGSWASCESSVSSLSVGRGVVLLQSSLSFVAILSFVSSLATAAVIGVAGLSRESSVKDVVVLFSSIAAGSIVDGSLPFTTTVAVSWLLSSEGSVASPLLDGCVFPFSVLPGIPFNSSGLYSDAT